VKQSVNGLDFDCNKVISKHMCFSANVAVECLSEKMEVSVEKCAVDDSLVILSSYSDSPLSSIPEECRSVEDSLHYNFTLGFKLCNIIPQVITKICCFSIKYPSIQVGYI